MATKVVAATLLCDRKARSQLVAIPHILKIVGLDRLYINVESNYRDQAFEAAYQPLTNLLAAGVPLPVDVDVWSWHSSWRKRPAYDQDQRRLDGIVTARNMARAYMLRMDATHLLFIDADVIVYPDGLQKLLALDRAVCGGLVPGRGAHSHVYYVFGPHRSVPEHPDVIECTHGTCGYMLVRRDVLSTLAFRFGASREIPGRALSEDPAFCSDAFLNGFGRYWIHKEVKAEHWDDPQHPFVADAAAKNSDIPQ